MSTAAARFEQFQREPGEAERRIVVIGGGAAGLSFLGRAVARGQRDVLLLEGDCLFGGVWQQTNYPSLAIHSQSFNYRFADFRPIASAGTHAVRSEVLEYFAAYAAERGLHEHLRLGTRAEKIEYRSAASQAARYKVFVRGGNADGDRELICSHVVCASGLSNAGTPQLPVFEGQDAFSGQICHSSAFSEAMVEQAKLEQAPICVLGGGKSAYDIVLALIRRGLGPQLTWLYRKPLWGFNYDLFYSGALDDIRRAGATLERFFQAVVHQPLGEQARSLGRQLIESGVVLNVDPDAGAVEQFRGAIYKPDELNLIRQSVRRVRAGAEGLTKVALQTDTGELIAARYLVCATGYRRELSLPPIEIVSGRGRRRTYDPGSRKLMFRGLIDPATPGLAYLASEVPFPQQLYGFSIYAEWLCRFITDELTTHYSDSDIDTENAQLEQSTAYRYNWLPRAGADNLSGGMPYLPVTYPVWRSHLARILADLGADSELAASLASDHWHRPRFEELDARIRALFVAR